MLSDKIKDLIIKEIDRVSLLDQSSKEKDGELLTLSLLFILRQFDGTKRAKFMIDMRGSYCRPVIITEQKVVLDQEFRDILNKES